MNKLNWKQDIDGENFLESHPKKGVKVTIHVESNLFSEDYYDPTISNTPIESEKVFWWAIKIFDSKFNELFYCSSLYLDNIPEYFTLENCKATAESFYFIGLEKDLHGDILEHKKASGNLTEALTILQKGK